MKSNYKTLGKFIRPVNIRNVELKATTLLGVNIDKFFMPSVANIIGTDMTAYKIIKKGQFACNRMHVGRDYRLPVAISTTSDNFLVSPAYDVFEVTNTEELLPEYLMMWLSRKEFDRNAWFYTDADVRGGLNWKAFCEMELPVPGINKQKEIVKEYNVLIDRIELNNIIIKKLEETAQTIYKQWFIDFEFPNKDGKPYKSSGGEMEFNEELEKDIPKKWNVKKLNQVSNIKYGKTLPTKELKETGFYVFGGNGVIGRFEKYIYEDPQVLIACRGAASGKISISFPKSFITNNSIVFETDNIHNFLYLKLYCFNNSFEYCVTGSAQPQVTIESLADIVLLWPEDLVLKMFSNLLQPLEFLILSKKMELEIHTELKDLLLRKMSKLS